MKYSTSKKLPLLTFDFRFALPTKLATMKDLTVGQECELKAIGAKDGQTNHNSVTGDDENRGLINNKSELLLNFISYLHR